MVTCGGRAGPAGRLYRRWSRLYRRWSRLVWLVTWQRVAGGGAATGEAEVERVQRQLFMYGPEKLYKCRLRPGPAPLAGPTVRRSDAGSVGMETGLSDGGHSDAYINSRQEARNAGEVPTQTRREDSDTEMTRITRRIGIAGDDSDNGR